MIPPMRILAIAAEIDRSEGKLFRRLKQSGVDLHIVHDACNSSADGFRRLDIPIDRLHFRSRFDPAAIRMLRRIIKSGGFDIVHTFTNRTLSNALFASIGIPVKHVTYRGTIGHLERANPASWMAHLNPRIDRVVCVSDAVREHVLSKGVPPERLITIYKGHDPRWYDGDPVVARADLGIPDDAFVAGFVGRIRPVKGVDVLLHAVALLPTGPNVHALLMGELNDRRVSALSRSESIRDRVHLAGYRKDATSLLRLCDVFVMPSVAREGLPRAVIEAMAQGIPPIVSNVGGLPELVVDGECGLVVPARDAESLAGALRELATNEEKRLGFGERARVRIATQFNVSEYIEQTLALYGELC